MDLICGFSGLCVSLGFDSAPGMENLQHPHLLVDLITPIPTAQVSGSLPSCCPHVSSSVSIQSSHGARYSESCESRQGIINFFFKEDNGERANIPSAWPWVIFFSVIFKDDAQRVNMGHN